MDQTVTLKVSLGYSFANNLGLQLYGRNWKKIEEMIGSRTGSQIRSHAQKYFLKTNKPFDSSGCLEQPPSKQECGEALPNV